MQEPINEEEERYKEEMEYRAEQEKMQQRADDAGENARLYLQ